MVKVGQVCEASSKSPKKICRHLFLFLIFLFLPNLESFTQIIRLSCATTTMTTTTATMVAKKRMAMTAAARAGPSPTNRMPRKRCRLLCWRIVAPFVKTSSVRVTWLVGPLQQTCQFIQFLLLFPPQLIPLSPLGARSAMQAHLPR